MQEPDKFQQQKEVFENTFREEWDRLIDELQEIEQKLDDTLEEDETRIWRKRQVEARLEEIRKATLQVSLELRRLYDTLFNGLGVDDDQFKAYIPANTVKVAGSTKDGAVVVVVDPEANKTHYSRAWQAIEAYRNAHRIPHNIAHRNYDRDTQWCEMRAEGKTGPEIAAIYAEENRKTAKRAYRKWRKKKANADLSFKDYIETILTERIGQAIRRHLKDTGKKIEDFA